MKKAILFIDTSSNKKIHLSLKINGKVIKKTKETKSWTSQILLPEIVKLLQQNKIKFSQIEEIAVKKGPGSFTGLRVGIAVANTLAWLLDIPVNGKKDRVVEPVY